MSMYDPTYDPGYDEHEQIRAEIAQLEQQVLADQQARWQAEQERQIEALAADVEAQLETLGVSSERDREMIVSRAINVAQTNGAPNLDLASAHLELHEAKMDTLPPPPDTPLPDGANASDRTQWMTQRMEQLKAHDEDMSHGRQFATPEGPPLDAGAQDRVAWMTDQVNGDTP